MTALLLSVWSMVITAAFAVALAVAGPDSLLAIGVVLVVVPALWHELFFRKRARRRSTDHV